MTNHSSGDEEAGDQDAIRERVIHLAFGNDSDRYDEFVRAIEEATPAGVDVILRGSAVTGHKWHSDEPFDADGPGTSDLDVTFVGGGMVALFRDFHIPGVHSAPLSEAHPFASPALGPLRGRLALEKHALRIDSPRVKKGIYPDGGSSTEIYTSPDPLKYIEMESLGPLKQLKPMDRLKESVTYQLSRRSHPTPEAEARALLHNLSGK